MGQARRHLVFTAAVAVINYAGDVSWVQVLTATVFTVGLHAGLSFRVLSNAWVTCLWQQQMIWDVYRDRAWASDEAEMAAEAEQMCHVEARVQKFAPEHGMEQITLAVSGARLGSWDAAGSVRISKARGHIELGHLWFFPESQPCLAQNRRWSSSARPYASIVLEARPMFAMNCSHRRAS